jgi:hypothetical protein
MLQKKVWGWTNPATAVVRNESIGFEVSEITVTNITDGKQYNWNSSMTDGYYVTVDDGTVTTSNGFTPLSQTLRIGATISGFTNANPGVITVDDTATFGFAAGDTIKVVELVDDGTGTKSLNNTFTVASVTSTTITLVENTSTTGYSVYVSGGKAIRVKDASGVPVAEENKAIYGITLGSGVVGGNNDVMTAIAIG